VKRWLSVACLGIIAILPLSVSAETYGQELQRMCYNGDKVKDLDRRISEADAMQDSIRYQLHYDQAREYFRCSKIVSNPYASDIATYLYAIELFESARTNREKDERDRTVEATANELAAVTRFDDIRKQALFLRDWAAIQMIVLPSPKVVPTDIPTP
jgi:hypothetical protein